MRSVWFLATFVAPIWHAFAGNPGNVDHAVTRGRNDCNSEFFDMTEKNLRYSGSDKYYRDFILEESQKYPKEYAELGEVSFFARHTFDGFDVHCGSKYEGCTGIPTCKRVLDHVQRHGGDKVLARKIYFSIKKIEFVADAIFWFHRVSIIIDRHAGLVSDMIVRDFSSRKTKLLDHSCVMIKVGHKTVSTTTKSLEEMIWSRPGGVSLGSIFSVAMKLVEQYGDESKDHVDVEVLRKLANGVVEIAKSSNVKAHLEVLCALERVSRKGSRRDPDLVYQGALLRKHIGKASSSVRDTISTILDLIVAGNAITNPEFNYLYELMSGHEWTEEARGVFNTFDEKSVTLFFERSLMRILWADAKCYQKCACSEISAKLCDDRTKDKRHRFCPKDGSGCICQIQCFATNPFWRHEGKLLGMDRLASWDIDFDKIITDSYAKYREGWWQNNLQLLADDFKPEFDPEKITPPSDDDEVVDLDKVDVVAKVGELLQKPGHDLLTLPVCASSEFSIEDFATADFPFRIPRLPSHIIELPSHLPRLSSTMTGLRRRFTTPSGRDTLQNISRVGIGGSVEKSHRLDTRDLNSYVRQPVFPCTCGDWRSSETQKFLEQLGLGVNQPGFKTEQARKIFTRECPGTLKSYNMKPFNHYLAFCELGIKFPQADDGMMGKLHSASMNRVDSRCAKLKDETKHMSEVDANFHFCSVSQTAKALFKEEHHFMSYAGLGPAVPDFKGNHWHMCRKWLHYK